MPQLIELFLSEDNFTHVYHLWLGPVLQAKGYDVRSISTFRCLILHLSAGSKPYRAQTLLLFYEGSSSEKAQTN